eukprot:TRINITY_DN515_c0_g1_i1.p1 TRINITY_DN515_c0_g1~~TRINITY_DN515_c0_g1_i1.p1  ORF type:complete len:277 (-),score=49.15 TRINITY_DN515_c0_g1_i1:549-1379(-)
MIRRPPRSTLSSSSAASDVYKRQVSTQSTGNDQYLKMAGRDKRWKRLPDLWEYVVPLGTTPEGEALSHEADAAFERKFGHPAGEHAMRWPPFRPGFKQMRYGDISSEYERFGITTHQKFQTLKEWCKATASQPSSRYGTPFKSTAGSCSSSPNLKGFAATGIPGEPAGILLTEGLGDHGLKGDAAIVLSNIAVLHPPPARHDKDAQMQRLLEMQVRHRAAILTAMQHTVACCVSANNSSSCSEVGSRVSSMASSLNPSHASSLLCTPEVLCWVRQC